MTTSISPEMPDGGAYAGRSHGEYKKAVAHSRLVRRLKLALPLASALVVVAFFAVSWFDGLAPEGVEIESATIEGGKLVMKNPVLSGQGSNDRPYMMRAERAIQDLSTPDVIVLETIVADLFVSAGEKAVVNAESGTYDRANETLVFDRPFNIATEGGMTAHMQSANIDLAAGNFATSDPVSIQSAEASIVAQSMEMLDKGRIITFKDTVRMTIAPSAVRAKDGVVN